MTTATESKWATPRDVVSDLELAFGGEEGLWPAWVDIPDEFKSMNHPWAQWQSEWFYRGLKTTPTAKDGIDADLAIRHLAAIQRSWAPKHEHKQAAVAYLASLWFEEPTQ